MGIGWLLLTTLVLFGSKTIRSAAQSKRWRTCNSLRVTVEYRIQVWWFPSVRFDTLYEFTMRNGNRRGVSLIVSLLNSSHANRGLALRKRHFFSWTIASSKHMALTRFLLHVLCTTMQRKIDTYKDMSKELKLQLLNVASHLTSKNTISKHAELGWYC